MKFIKALTLILLIDILAVFSVTFAQNWDEIIRYNQQKRSQTNCRFPLFSCRLYNKFRSTKRETGFNGSPQPQASNQALSYDQYSQASSAYPSYSVPVYAGPSYGQNYQDFNQNYQNMGYQAQPGEYAMASAPNAQYAAYAPPTGYTAQSYGQSPNTIDVHQVLDQFIRSAGLSPQGDHEAQASHASSFAKAGTKPVFVFKKLLSFPFYINTDPNVVDVNGKYWK